MGIRELAVGSAAGGAALSAATYLGLITGAVPVDLGVGRRARRLGPLVFDIAAPPETVFDVVAEPYGQRATRAMRAKVQVLQRGEDMVLAAHHTPVRGRLVATTVETVLFDRPGRVDFRLVRGPVPYVAETFTLDDHNGATRLVYTGELGTDLWALGQWWGDLVAEKWVRVVAATLHNLKAEAERRHDPTRRNH